MGEAILGQIGNFRVHKDIDSTTSAYHIYSLEYFSEFLKERKVFFHKINMWRDVYELPSKFISNAIDLSSSLYGHCLTYNFDREVMWRLYSGIDGKEENMVYVLK